MPDDQTCTKPLRNAISENSVDFETHLPRVTTASPIHSISKRLVQAAAVAFCLSADSTEVFLTGITDGGSQYRYFVNSAQLSQQATWVPGEQRFPLELSSAVTEARRHISESRRITNHLEPTQLRIARVLVPGWRSLTNAELGSLSNHWFAAVTFRYSADPSNSAPQGYESSVVLLDGSLASEKHPNGERANSETDSSAGPSDQRHNVSPSAAGQQHPQPGPDPAALLKTANSPVPKVQWNALAEPFPMDIEAQVLESRKCLHQNTPCPEPVLQQIEINRFAPTEGVLPERLTSNLWHWLMTLRFSSCSSPDAQTCDVNILLDGSVLNVVKDALSPRRTIVDGKAFTR